MRAGVSGIPRGHQSPRADGNWLTPDEKASLEATAAGVEIVEIPPDTVPTTPEVDVLLAEGGNRVHYPGELDREDYLRFFGPRLAWVQICSTGFRDNITPDIESGRVTLTNAPGLHTVPIAESVLAGMLDHVKNLPARRDDQARRVWRPQRNGELEGAVVLIVGLGRIGSRVAALCRAFGMIVIGTRRTPAPVEHVEHVFPPGELRAHLPQADFVVLAAPHTAQTEGLLDDAAIRAMKPSAYLVNIGRGQIVDEDALIRALEERRIAGAYLDAFTIEPLPSEHPLWSLPEVLLVPHDSHSSPRIGARMVEIFRANLERYVAGQPLHNVCDCARGY